MRRISEYVLYESFLAGAEDSHGNETETWLPAVRVGIYAYNPGTTDEPFDAGTDRTITNPTIYVPTATKLTPRGRVTLEAEEEPLEIVGETLPYRNPYDSSMNGNVVNLKRVSG
jgi:hypothetical protein